MKCGQLDFNGIRSLLFVPVLNERFISRAHTRGADAIIFDLEDSIALDRKTAARNGLESALTRLRPHGFPLLARVNNTQDLFEDDLRAAVAAGADAILIPKVESAEGLCRVSDGETEFCGDSPSILKLCGFSLPMHKIGRQKTSHRSIPS